MQHQRVFDTLLRLHGKRVSLVWMLGTSGAPFHVRWSNLRFFVVERLGLVRPIRPGCGQLHNCKPISLTRRVKVRLFPAHGTSWTVQA